MASPTLRQMLLAAVRVLGWLIRYNSALRDAGQSVAMPCPALLHYTWRGASSNVGLLVHGPVRGASSIVGSLVQGLSKPELHCCGMLKSDTKICGMQRTP